MLLDGAWREPEDAGDLRAGPALDKQANHIEFSRRESVAVARPSDLRDNSDALVCERTPHTICVTGRAEGSELGEDFTETLKRLRLVPAR
jgi:hypothetical protein